VILHHLRLARLLPQALSKLTSNLRLQLSPRSQSQPLRRTLKVKKKSAANPNSVLLVPDSAIPSTSGTQAAPPGDWLLELKAWMSTEIKAALKDKGKSRASGQQSPDSSTPSSSSSSTDSPGAAGTSSSDSSIQTPPRAQRAPLLEASPQAMASGSPAARSFTSDLASSIAVPTRAIPALQTTASTQGPSFVPPAPLPVPDIPLEPERRIIPNSARVSHSGMLIWDNLTFHPEDIDLCTQRDGSQSIEIPLDRMHHPEMLALHKASSPLAGHFHQNTEQRIKSCFSFLDSHISEKTGWKLSHKPNSVAVSKLNFPQLYQEINTKARTGAKLNSKPPLLILDSELELFKFLQGPKLNNDFNTMDPTLSGIFNNIKLEEFTTECQYRYRALQAVKVLEMLGTVNSSLSCIPELSLSNPHSTLTSKISGINELLSVVIDYSKDLANYHLQKSLASKMALRLRAVGDMEPEAVRKKLTMSDLLQPSLFAQEAIEEAAPTVEKIYHINFKPAQKRHAASSQDPTIRKKPRSSMQPPPTGFRPAAQPFRYMPRRQHNGPVANNNSRNFSQRTTFTHRTQPSYSTQGRASSSKGQSDKTRPPNKGYPSSQRKPDPHQRK